MSAGPIGIGSGGGAGEHRLLGGDAGHVEQRHRPEARQRGAEMLQGVGARDLRQPLDHRDLPVGTAGLTDDAAQRTPFAEVAR